MREANPPATPRTTQQQGKENTKRETKDIDARGYIYRNSSACLCIPNLADALIFLIPFLFFSWAHSHSPYHFYYYYQRSNKVRRLKKKGPWCLANISFVFFFFKKHDGELPSSSSVNFFKTEIFSRKRNKEEKEEILYLLRYSRYSNISDWQVNLLSGSQCY